MDPMKRFIGIKGDSPPWELLGLTKAISSPKLIDEALKKRLKQVDAHPDGLNKDAIKVRKKLHHAADLLTKAAKLDSSKIKSAQQSQSKAVGKLPSRPTPGWTPRASERAYQGELTMFDRQVMAVLIGYGGWNFTSRAKLVALAVGNGLSVQGLVRVVSGLSEYAKSGGPRLGIEEITSGTGRIESSLVTASIQADENIFDNLPSEHIIDDHTWAKIKLSLIFGAITLIIMLVIARIALFPGSDIPVQIDKAQLPVIDPSENDMLPLAPILSPETSKRKIANFKPLPTFLGDAIPPQAADALNECDKYVDDLDLIARKITVEDDPSQTIFRDWKVIVQTIGDAWLLLDARTQESLNRAILEVFYASADKPSVSDELLTSLTPITGRFYEPVEIWRSLWMVLELQRISQRKDLASAIKDRAQLQLDIAINDNRFDELTDDITITELWLISASNSFIEVLEIEADIYDYWDCWIRAARYVSQGERLNNSLMRTTKAIMQTSTDLSNPGPSINVMGRLLSMSNYKSSYMVKQSVKDLFDDQEKIDTDDLWVLTSLLWQSKIASWFSEDLVLAYDADWVYRRRTADRIMQRWPPEADKNIETADDIRGLKVDPSLGPRWISLVEQILSDPVPARPQSVMKQMLITSWLNEAAARLVAGKTVIARELINRSEAAIMSPDSNVLNRSLRFSSEDRPGQAIGNDAQWAVTFEEEGRNTAEKIRLLRLLLNNAGTDLGPIDAGLFVNIIYRGSPQEVRALAGSVLVNQFPNGPNIALEMLDQFPGVSSSGTLSDTITRLTGQLLGPVRSNPWKSEARLALVEHCLKLHSGGNSQINLLSELIAESYLNRAASLKGNLKPIAGADSPLDAAQQLLQAWRNRAISAIVVNPVPGDLSAVRRRHNTRLSLAQGTLQQFVAHQLAVLDLLTYMTSAEQPDLTIQLRSLLGRATARRNGINKVLNQATDIERTILEMWSLRLDVSTTSGRIQ